MKIVYLGAFRFPDKDAAAARVLNNAKVFKALGHEVEFISWGGEYSDSERLQNGEYSHNGFRYRITNSIDLSGRSINKMKQYINRVPETIKTLRQLDYKPDLVIAYNAGFRLTRSLLKYCSANKIKLANDITEWYEYREMPFFERIQYWYNMKHLQKRVDNKIVISSYLDRTYASSNNVILPPLCDSTDAKWNIRLKEGTVSPFNGITLIYAGTPAKKDDLDSVVNAVDDMAKNGRNIRIIILGVTKEQYIMQNPKVLHELHDNVIFCGRVSQELVPAYYRTSDFMVLLRKPTRKNNSGFPTKVAESFTAGVPVITNMTSDLGKYITNGINGFILKDSSEQSLISTLQTILAYDQTHIDRLKKEARSSSSLFELHSYLNIVSSFIAKLR